MTSKYEECVLKVKSKGTVYNPWAVCAANIGRYGGKPSEHMIMVQSGQKRRLYQGPRGGHFYIIKGKKYYIR